MTIARLRRLQRLEARQPRSKPWTDPYPAIMALWGALEAEHAATKARREFSRLPRPPSKWDEETRDAFDRAIAEHDSIARRLATAADQAA
jgi:hypothetical protein